MAKNLTFTPPPQLSQAGIHWTPLFVIANLTGTIPIDIGELTSLTILDLSSNGLVGSIPSSISHLTNLQDLILNSNQLTGKIPGELSNCTQLKNLLLFDTHLSGDLPVELGNLYNSEVIRIGGNKGITGKIPDEIGNCKKLTVLGLADTKISGSIPPSLVDLYLYENDLSGSLPVELGSLQKPEKMLLWQNNLVGPIPKEIGNCKSLRIIDFSLNFFSGSLPWSFGNLTLLEELMISNNNISGPIPPVLSNAKNLVQLHLDTNEISGLIPLELGMLKELSVFFSWQSLFQLKNLTKLLLIFNDISGPIPQEVGNCSSLVRLRLVNNKISWRIPREIGLLDYLSFLDLSKNRLTGQVLEEIGNCSELQMLNLNSNTLEGNLPGSLSSLKKFQVLDVSMNQFVGQIPWTMASQVPFRWNCLILSLLIYIAVNLSWNDLTGIIPPQILGLNKLSVLDLSHNKLVGDLMALSGLKNLISLNVSYNNFTGYLPDNKLFRQLFRTELGGNQGLCSRGQDSCFLSSAKGMGKPNDKPSKRLKLTIALLSVVTMAMVMFGAVAVFRVQKLNSGNNDSEIGGGDSLPWQFTPFQKLNFTVEQNLRCLVEANVIGKGCSGVIYHAELEDGKVITVMKLWPTIVVSGYYQNDRSLLHERSGCCLEWELRYGIVLGAAQGLAYLHHDCVPPIVHRDIKANNILIGLKFEPYIADFGLAKLVDNEDFARSSNTVAGSYGYIAPEYGYMMKITEKSDVYSYGVVVLEVLTEKQPIDPTIPDGLHIVDWVRQRRGGVDVLDLGLSAWSESEIEEMM
ncbi:hypothetical protein LguiB_000454 [Lonicera macranthoides]